MVVQMRNHKVVNEKKIRQTLPTLLTPPNLSLWEQGVERERNDYHNYKFKKNAPSVEQEKFRKVVDVLIEYKDAQEQFWKQNRNKRKQDEPLFF